MADDGRSDIVAAAALAGRRTGTNGIASKSASATRLNARRNDMNRPPFALIRSRTVRLIDHSENGDQCRL
jgi:hypothetical protein